MIPRPHAPRVRRSSIVLAIAVAALAFPLGVLATHQFSDVPTGASYHDDVDALVSAGVTTGCGDGKYCPSNNVTRGQMAQFLNRLGNLDGNSTPSVDADMVDGLHADELASLTFADKDAELGGQTATTVTEINSVAIDVPVDGVLVISGQAFVRNQSATIVLPSLTAFLDGGSVTVSGFAGAATLDVAGASDAATIAYTAAFPVSAGAHTVSQSLANNQGTFNIFYNLNELTVTFVPSASSSATVAAPTTDGGPASDALGE